MLMMMMMMLVMMRMRMLILQNKAMDVPLHTSSLSATQPMERELPRGTQLFEAVTPDQPPVDALRRPLVHQSAYKQTSGEAIYVDDMPAIQGRTPGLRGSVTLPPPPTSPLCVQAVPYL